MRPLLFTLTFLFISLVALAQSDSLELKLQKYKSLLEKGLIDEKEYKDLKDAVLKNEMQRAPDPGQGAEIKTMSLTKLRKDAIGNFVAGGIMTAAGTTSILYALTIKKNSTDPQTMNTKKDQSIIFGIFGGIFAAGGLGCLVKGTVEAHHYNKNKGRLELTLSPAGPSLIYTFR